MESLFREYNKNDYAQCEELVNKAWKFDDNFKPLKMANISKCLYTKGSELGSNYRKVVEVDGQVAGFIFGFNETRSKFKLNKLFQLSILWRLILVKHSKKGGKKNLLKALSVHETNRSRIVGRGRSEIVLFVVGNQYQSLGYGKKLLSSFLEDCRVSGVETVIVETNKLGASSFYEKVGFRHLSNFDSPLHEYATKGGQACMYEYKC